MFESEFLTPTPEAKALYQRLVSEAAQIVCTSLSGVSYNGKNAAAVDRLVSTDFLPQQLANPEAIATILRTVVSHSVDVNHHNTVAHLHCPPLLAVLAAEVVISALN